MADHAWVQENIGSYVTGGLEVDERSEFEEHIGDCRDCSGLLADTKTLDEQLERLFAPARPRPGLEDRAIQRLRNQPNRRATFLPFIARSAMAAAAVLVLGVFGAGMSYLGEHVNLPFPGQSRSGRTGDVAFFEKRTGGAQWAQHDLGVEGRDSDDGEVYNVDRLAQEVLNSIDERAPARGLAVSPDGKTLTRDATRRHDRNMEGERPAEEVTLVPGGPVPTDSAGIAGGMARPGTATVATLVPADKPNQGKAGESWGRVPGRGEPVAGQPPTNSAAPAGFGGDRAGAADKPANDPYLGFLQAPLHAPTGKPALSSSVATVTEGAKGKYFEPAKVLKVADNEKGEAKADPKSPPPPPESKPARPAGDQVAQGKEAEPKPPEPAPQQRKIIRQGDIEFEVEAFDTAVDKITRIVAEEKGFVATINSDKLANGKVKGSIVVRVPPDRLDTLILKLRALGELKGQRIGSQDVTKHYYDLESRLRAARAMEGRLIEIIKTGKGEIKDLLLAEKELGVWRTRIEEFEGEMRYYNNLIALSTLTINLVESEIRSQFGVAETEKIEMGLEVEDVEKALKEAYVAIAEAKGRVTKSELKHHGAGQYQATLHFEAAPDAAGPLRDRFKQLGQITRLEVGRIQEAEGGSARPLDTKVKRNDARFFVSLYNVANVAPRETVQLSLVCTDTETAYRTLLARLEKATGRVVSHRLDRQRNDQTRGTVHFEIKSNEADAVLTDVKLLGDVLRLQVVENTDSATATRSKRGFQVELFALGMVPPRETANIHLVTRDVPESYRSLQDIVARAKGRMLNANLNEQDPQNISAELDFEVRRSEEAGIRKALGASGEIYSQNVMRAPDTQEVIDTKVRLRVTLINLARIPPRETVNLGMEVRNVEQSVEELKRFVTTSKGREAESPQVTRDASGRVTARVSYDVPLASAAALVQQLKDMGVIRAQKSQRNLQVPESELAVARVDVMLTNPSQIIGEKGMGESIRDGLAFSLKAIGFSLTWVTVGVLFVLPWAVVAWGIYRVSSRFRREEPTTPPAAGA